MVYRAVSENVRKYYRNVIDYLPTKFFTCLDLGLGVNFVLEKMLQKIQGRLSENLIHLKANPQIESL